MNARRIVILPLITSIAASTVACSAGPGDDHVTADRQARALGIDSYVIEASDDGLDVVLYDAHRTELGVVTLAEVSGATDMFVSLADSSHTLAMRVEGRTAEVMVDEQSSTDYALVADHLQILEAVMTDDVVDARGDGLQWRRSWLDYAAYSVCFYAALAGGATITEAGAACSEIYL